MRLIICFVAFVLASCESESGSGRDWTPVVQADDGTVVYIRESSIKAVGAFWRVWTLSNYAEPTEFGAMSQVVLEQFDCETDRASLLTGTIWSQPNARGEDLGSWESTGEDWAYPLPGSVKEAVLKRVCAKR
jgi:hypothetical protein